MIAIHNHRSDIAEVMKYNLLKNNGGLKNKIQGTYLPQKFPEAIEMVLLSSICHKCLPTAYIKGFLPGKHKL